MKKFSLDLTKLQNSLDARFSPTLIEDGLLEIDNKLGFPKHIYVNKDGEIWTSDADQIYDGGSLKEVQKTIRTIAASGAAGQVFKMSDLLKLLAPPCALEQPQMDEDAVLEQGDEMTNDIMQEPEMQDLDLSPEDEHEVAVMIISSVVDDKNEKLQEFNASISPKVASFLNQSFKHLRFAHLGEDKIKVFFESKMASETLSRSEFEEFLKFAGSDLKNFDLYYQNLVSEFSAKVSSSLPDFFKIRNFVINEVLEQVNEI